MTKTLADMTAEERADCVGMWADAMGQGLGVIVNATELSDCWVLFPEDGGNVATCRNRRVTPRFDLPRAWTPGGQPVSVSKEYGQCEIGGTPDGTFATIVHVDGGRTEYAPDGTPHGEVYRWVGEWKQDNEHP